MLALSLVFLAVGRPGGSTRSPPAGWLTAVSATDTIIWVAFAAEYLIRLVLVPRPGRSSYATSPT